MIEAAGLIAGAASDMHDPEFKRWSKANWADYLLSALRALALVRPDAFRVTAAVALKEGHTHHIPEDGLRFIELQANVDEFGYPADAITRVDGSTLARFAPGWRADAPADSVEHYLWDERRPTEFQTVPPVRDGVSVILVYAAEPAAIEAPTDDDWPELDIEAHYATQLRHWLLYRAHSKQTSMAAKQAAAQERQAFYAALGEKVPGQQFNDPRSRDNA
ncbi:MAG: hypothetical protein LAT50_13680 [Ectothiorhodospiraceae bacterium]|nr:hypothetical protein [Ectothiorhodospiraceae bacterium]